jgi:ABC-2 type transport system permease protein
MAERERVGMGGLRRHVASFAGALRAQIALTRQNVEDLRPILTMPLVALMALAVLLHAGRPDLAPYALVAATLMTLGQMGNFVASEVVFQDRFEQTLELMVASPAPYFTVLAGRVLVLTLLGMSYERGAHPA